MRRNPLTFLKDWPDYDIERAKFPNWQDRMHRLATESREGSVEPRPADTTYDISAARSIESDVIRAKVYQKMAATKFAYTLRRTYMEQDIKPHMYKLTYGHEKRTSYPGESNYVQPGLTPPQESDIRPELGAINLILTSAPTVIKYERVTREDKQTKTALYRAFTIMHRAGDALGPIFAVVLSDRDPDGGELYDDVYEETKIFVESADGLYSTDIKKASNDKKKEKALAKAQEVFERDLFGEWHVGWSGVDKNKLLRLLSTVHLFSERFRKADKAKTAVDIQLIEKYGNTKMIREKYFFNSLQCLSDLFALHVLRPSQPLFVYNSKMAPTDFNKLKTLEMLLRTLFDNTQDLFVGRSLII